MIVRLQEGPPRTAARRFCASYEIALQRAWLVKAAGVGMVLLVAAALIIWLLLGMSPIPAWFTKLVERMLHSLRAIKS